MLLFLITAELPDKRNRYTTLVVQFPEAAVLAGLVDFHRMRHIATEDVVTFQNQSSTIVGKLPFNAEDTS